MSTRQLVLNTDWRRLIGVPIAVGGAALCGLLIWSGLHRLGKPPMRCVIDVGGIENPPLYTARDARLSDTAEVVGIELDGQASAFVLDAMRDDPRLHIVHRTVGKTRLTVTYCDLSDQVRVLSSPADSRSKLRVGGLNQDNEMVFLLDGQRYDQQSTQLPLPDFPYARLKLGEWKRRYPNTKIYAGPLLSQMKLGERTTQPSGS